MRKFSLATAIVLATVGFGGIAATGSAFAADGVCLNPDAGVIDLTHNAMIPGAGWGYDKTAVDAELAKGNRCSVVQQSQPVSGHKLTDYQPGGQVNNEANSQNNG